MIVAVVPAAGLSSRMGRPKPLLDLGDGPLIARVVVALREGGADRVVVVVPPAGRDDSAPIAAAAEHAGAEVVVPAEQPPDMRASIEAGLDHLLAGPTPATLLIAPADSPGLHAALVARVIAEGRAQPEAIVVPRAGATRGHPIGLPWTLVAAIRDLPRDQGVNACLDDPSHRVVYLPINDPRPLLDLDSPEDFRRWTGRDLA